MTATTIKAKIKSVLLSITGVEQVEDYPNQDFSAYPAVQVAYEGHTSERHSNEENDVVHTFKAFVFQVVEGAIDRSRARIILEELTDTICDTFDSDEFLAGISLPAGKTIIGIKPTNVLIGEDEEGKFTVSEIELAVRVNKDV